MLSKWVAIGIGVTAIAVIVVAIGAIALLGLRTARPG